MLSRITSLAVYVVLPIVGVIWFGWDWRFILILYWFENITVMVTTAVQVVRSPHIVRPGEPLPVIRVNGNIVPTTKGKISSMYGLVFTMFTFVHGIFVFAIVGGGFGADVPDEPLRLGPVILSWGVASLVQIGASLFTAKKELPTVVELTKRPLKRMFVLHLTVIGAAFVLMRLEWTKGPVIILVVLHFVLDMREGLSARKAVTPSQTQQ